jgi:hypothetical protein
MSEGFSISGGAGTQNRNSFTKYSVQTVHGISQKRGAEMLVVRGHSKVLVTEESRDLGMGRVAKPVPYRDHAYIHKHSDAG